MHSTLLNEFIYEIESSICHLLDIMYSFLSIEKPFHRYSTNIGLLGDIGILNFISN